MRLTVPEIDCSEGFTPNNDIFERKGFADKLEDLLSKSEDENLVIAINEKWGNGKSTFLKMWKNNIIKDDKFKVVYFDAFQNDFQTDPFLAISAHIYNTIEDNNLKRKYLDVTKRVTSVIIKASLKVGASALTLGALKGTDYEDIKGDLSNAVNDPLQQYIEDKITQLDKENNTLDHFRATLSEIASDKKLIFIIDELDRARPSYSLELLERIKHVFNTKNIYFVLAVDKDQFTYIIKKTYGEIDANMYLNKFIHLWFSLPKTNNPDTESYILHNYLKYISTKIYEKNKLIEYSLINLSYLLRINNLTLRDAERCFSTLLLLNAKIENGFRWEYQIGAAIVSYIKLSNESLLNRIIMGSLTIKELVLELGISEEINYDNQHIHCAINTELMTKEEYHEARKSNERIVFNEFSQLKTISHCAKLIEDYQF